MNTKRLVVAGILLASSSIALGQQTEFVRPDANFLSSKTRAQVNAELRQAKADGSYAAMHREFSAPDANFVASKTRAQVVAELERSRADGSYDALHQEYIAADAGFKGTGTRAGVIAEGYPR